MPYGFTKNVYQEITAYIRETKYAFKVIEIICRESEKGRSRYINEKDNQKQNKADLSHKIPILKLITCYRGYNLVSHRVIFLPS